MLSISLATIALVSTTAYIFSAIKIMKMSKDLLEVTELYNNLEQVVMTESNTDGIDLHTQNFIKFLSDSREMAFEYIDQAQEEIKRFIDIADKELAFFDSYGALTEGHLYYENLKVISEEYKKLKTLLPEESK
jgi:hypothetical protein